MGYVLSRQLTACLRDRGSIPGSGKVCVYIWKVRTVFGAHPTSYFMGTGSCCPESEALGSMKLTDHTNLVPEENISRAAPPSSLGAEPPLVGSFGLLNDDFALSWTQAIQFLIFI